MKPVSYLQIDKKWKDLPYRVKGETSTIGRSGCGPSCMAMVISTLTGKTVTPVDTCKWSVEHGYKALNQGTYYTYFKPQGAAYNIDVKQLNSTNIYHNSNSQYHQTVLSFLKSGGMVIACMGRGTWTRGGHYILLWGVNSDGSININDPASTKLNRVRGNWNVLKNEVKYYFIVSNNHINNKKPRDDKKSRLAAKFGIADATADYLSKYKYKDSLFNKLLGDTSNLTLHKDTISYILKYEYGADLLRKLCK